jgi:hypothetical protein
VTSLKQAPLPLALLLLLLLLRATLRTGQKVQLQMQQGGRGRAAAVARTRGGRGQRLLQLRAPLLRPLLLLLLLQARAQQGPRRVMIVSLRRWGGVAALAWTAVLLRCCCGAAERDLACEARQCSSPLHPSHLQSAVGAVDRCSPSAPRQHRMQALSQLPAPQAVAHSRGRRRGWRELATPPLQPLLRLADAPAVQGPAAASAPGVHAVPRAGQPVAVPPAAERVRAAPVAP